MRVCRRGIAALSAIVPLCALLAWGDTVTLTPSADTTIFQQFPDNNLGGLSTMIIGGIARDNNQTGIRARGLVRFDLANRIPTNAEILSATFRLQVVDVPSSAVNGNVELHRLLRSWGEGDKNERKGLPATADEATWNERFSLAPGGGWTDPGGRPDVDFSSTISSSVFVADDFFYVWPSTTNLISDVRHWLQNPAENFGWMIINEAEESPRSARRYTSRNDTFNPGNQPRLVIEYRAAPAFQLRIGSAAVSSNQFWVTATAEPGKSYRLEARDDFVSSAWSTVTNITATSGSLTLTDATLRLRRFYRIASP